MRHEDNQQVILLREVGKTVEGLADILRLVLPSLFVLQPVVRVDDQSLDTFAAHEGLRLVEYGLQSEVVVGADEVEIRFEVFLDLTVFPVGEVLFVEVLARELLDELRGMVCERGVLRTEVGEAPAVAHVQPLGNLVDELRFAASWYARHHAKTFGLETTQTVEILVADGDSLLHPVLK